MGKPTRLILSVTQGESDCFGNPNFVVDITPEYASRLVQSIELLRMLEANDSSVYKLHYWDDTGSFVDGDPGEDGTAFEERIRTECDQVMVYNDQLRWFAYPKHTDIRLESDSVTLNDLRKLADRIPGAS